MVSIHAEKGTGLWQQRPSCHRWCLKSNRRPVGSVDGALNANFNTLQAEKIKKNEGGGMLPIHFVLAHCVQANQLSQTALLPQICAWERALPSCFTFIINKIVTWPWLLLYWIHFLQMSCLKCPYSLFTWREMMDTELFEPTTNYLQSEHDSTLSPVFKKYFMNLNISGIVLRNIFTFSKSSLAGAVSNLRACHIHIPHDLWLKLNQAEMAEKETTWNLTIMDRSWLVSGYCVYSAAMCYSTGGRLAASTQGGRQSCIIEADRGSDCWPGSLLPAGIIEPGWTADRSNCHLTCMCRHHNGWPH